MPICICKSARPTLWICRIFGLIPLSWSHKNGKCIISVSKCWTIYSLLICCAYAARISQISNIAMHPFSGDRSFLLEYISTVVEAFIGVATVHLILINIYRSKHIAGVLNKLTELSNYNLLCQCTLKKHQKIGRHYVCFILFSYILQYSAILSLNLMDQFDTNWNYERLIMPIVQTTFMLLQGIFACLCALYISLLSCYDNMMENSLGITLIHPMEEFKETKKIRAIFAIEYELCLEKHLIKKENNIELMEHLQLLFKEIKTNLDILNAAFNPQILMHMTCELVILIVHFYAVIIFMTFDETSPSDKSNNFFNWYFILLRGLNIYSFLNLAQQVENSIKRLINYLIEYSTRINTPEEHQQVRIFVQQLDNNKGFTASGMFSINLQIAAPICANILMYVLVAVQFKIPHKLEFLAVNSTSNSTGMLV